MHRIILLDAQENKIFYHEQFSHKKSNGELSQTMACNSKSNNIYHFMRADQRESKGTDLMHP